MLSPAMDNLTPLPTMDPSATWSAASRAAGAPSFGDYLQQAQTRPTETAGGGNAASGSTPSAADRQPAPPAPASSDPRDGSSPAAAQAAAADPAGGQPAAEAPHRAPGQSAEQQPPQQGASGSSHPSPDGDKGPKAGAGGPDAEAADPREKEGKDAGVVLELQAVVPGAMPPVAPPVPAADAAPAPGSDVGETATAAAAAATATGVSDTLPDGAKARTAAKPIASAAVAAASAHMTETVRPDVLAEPAAQAPRSLKPKAGESEKPAEVAVAEPAVAADVVPAAAGVAAATVPFQSGLSPSAQPDGKVEAVVAAIQNDRPAAAPEAAAANSSAGPPQLQASRYQRATKMMQAIAAADGSAGGHAAAGSMSADGGNTAAAGAAVAASQDAASGAPGAAGQTAQAGALAPAERTRFVQRVEGAIQAMAGQGGTVRLRLSPPDLGSLRIEMTLRHGELTARLEVENPTARNLLLDHLPDLRDRLAQQGIKVQHFDIDLSDRSAGGMADQGGQFAQFAQSQSGHPGSHSAPRPAAANPAPSAAEPTAPPQGIGGGSQLNIVV